MLSLPMAGKGAPEPTGSSDPEQTGTENREPPGLHNDRHSCALSTEKERGSQRQMTQGSLGRRYQTSTTPPIDSQTHVQASQPSSLSTHMIILPTPGIFLSSDRKAQPDRPADCTSPPASQGLLIEYSVPAHHGPSVEVPTPQQPFPGSL